MKWFVVVIPYVLIGYFVADNIWTISKFFVMHVWFAEALLDLWYLLVFVSIGLYLKTRQFDFKRINIAVGTTVIVIGFFQATNLYGAAIGHMSVNKGTFITAKRKPLDGTGVVYYKLLFEKDCKFYVSTVGEFQLGKDLPEYLKLVAAMQKTPEPEKAQKYYPYPYSTVIAADEFEAAFEVVDPSRIIFVSEPDGTFVPYLTSNGNRAVRFEPIKKK